MDQLSVLGSYHWTVLKWMGLLVCFSLSLWIGSSLFLIKSTKSIVSPTFAGLSKSCTLMPNDSDKVLVGSSQLLLFFGALTFFWFVFDQRSKLFLFFFFFRSFVRSFFGELRVVLLLPGGTTHSPPSHSELLHRDGLVLEVLVLVRPRRPPSHSKDPRTEHCSSHSTWWFSSSLSLSSSWMSMRATSFLTFKSFSFDSGFPVLCFQVLSDEEDLRRARALRYLRNCVRDFSSPLHFRGLTYWLTGWTNGWMDG